MIKSIKTIVMIIGHNNPHYLIDTAESVRFYNNGNYDIVFVIDFNIDAASVLIKKYGSDKVFVSKEKNGWGRGILRTIIHALDYFKTIVPYDNLITMDSDALCVGPFIDRMLEKITPEIFFVGTVWWSPGHDHNFHHRLRSSGFMSNYPFVFRTEMAAGPCMLWTKHCLKFLETVNLIPGYKFDIIYPNILFAHDQLSAYLNSCGVGRIAETNYLMEIKWRESLPVLLVPNWGLMPITYETTAIIHPTQSNNYTEDNCRKYFRNKRKIVAQQGIKLL